MGESKENGLCIFCKHFTAKLMLNGYHGICERQGCFTMFKEHCDQWEKREADDGPNKQTEGD